MNVSSAITSMQAFMGFGDPNDHLLVTIGRIAEFIGYFFAIVGGVTLFVSLLASAPSVGFGVAFNAGLNDALPLALQGLCCIVGGRLLRALPAYW